MEFSTTSAEARAAVAYFLDDTDQGRKIASAVRMAEGALAAMAYDVDAGRDGDDASRAGALLVALAAADRVKDLGCAAKKGSNRLCNKSLFTTTNATTLDGGGVFVVSAAGGVSGFCRGHLEAAATAAEDEGKVVLTIGSGRAAQRKCDSLVRALEDAGAENALPEFWAALCVRAGVTAPEAFNVPDVLAHLSTTAHAAKGESKGGEGAGGDGVGGDGAGTGAGTNAPAWAAALLEKNTELADMVLALKQQVEGGRTASDADALAALGARCEVARATIADKVVMFKIPGLETHLAKLIARDAAVATLQARALAAATDASIPLPRALLDLEAAALAEPDFPLPVWGAGAAGAPGRAQSLVTQSGGSGAGGGGPPGGDLPSAAAFDTKGLFDALNTANLDKLAPFFDRTGMGGCTFKGDIFALFMALDSTQRRSLLDQSATFCPAVCDNAKNIQKPSIYHSKLMLTDVVYTMLSRILEWMRDQPALAEHAQKLGKMNLLASIMGVIARSPASRSAEEYAALMTAIGDLLNTASDRECGSGVPSVPRVFAAIITSHAATVRITCCITKTRSWPNLRRYLVLKYWPDFVEATATPEALLVWLERRGTRRFTPDQENFGADEAVFSATPFNPAETPAHMLNPAREVRATRQVLAAHADLAKALEAIAKNLGALSSGNMSAVAINTLQRNITQAAKSLGNMGLLD